MKIKELMTSEVEACRPTTDLAAVSMTMWRQDCGIVPVIDETRRVLGVVTDRDICMALATRHCRAEELTAQDVMSDRLFLVRPDEEGRVALETMRTQRVRRLPVVDADQRLRGMVSINDLVLHAQPSGGRATLGLSANEVLVTLHGICRHPVPARRPQEKDQLVAAHA
jgi:CBS domain-containing protein